MQYRGMKIGSSIWTNFSLNDVPVLLMENVIALVSIDSSPLLNGETITRGLDDSNIFEGDYVLDKDTGSEIGIVTYDNGFRVHLYTGLEEKIFNPNHIYMRGDRRSIQILNDCIHRTPIRFRYQDVIFDFSNIIEKQGSNLLVSKNDYPLLIPITAVSELLAIDEFEDDYLFTGDFYNGGIATLKYIQQTLVTKGVTENEENIHN